MQYGANKLRLHTELGCHTSMISYLAALRVLQLNLEGMDSISKQYLSRNMNSIINSGDSAANTQNIAAKDMDRMNDAIITRYAPRLAMKLPLATTNNYNEQGKPDHLIATLDGKATTAIQKKVQSKDAHRKKATWFI